MLVFEKFRVRIKRMATQTIFNEMYITFTENIFPSCWVDNIFFFLNFNISHRIMWKSSEPDARNLIIVLIHFKQLVDNKAKARISKQVLHRCLSGGKKCTFLGKIGVACFCNTRFEICPFALSFYSSSKHQKTRVFWSF